MMIDKISEEILEYFNRSAPLYKKGRFKGRHYPKGYLNVLDNKYRNFYTGVSLQYIVYDLLKSKYKKTDVCKALFNLISNDKLKAIYCINVRKIVFENINIDHNIYHMTSKQKVLNYLKEYIK